MKLRTLILDATLGLTAVAGVAQADTAPVPYHYGMPMNIDKVISMNEAPTDECKVIKADIKFLDKAGKVEDVSYHKLSDACSFQN